MKLLIIILAIIFPDLALAKAKSKAVVKSKDEIILSDHWYILQAGSTAWGYYHEAILQRGDRFFYRYDMTKRENDRLYEENLGAVAQQDLMPVAFNLNKSGLGVSESYSGTFEDRGDTGLFTVRLAGSRSKVSKRHVRRNTILEAFFPVWIHQHWKEIKTGYRASLPVFSEDPQSGEYQVRMARIDYKEEKIVMNVSCKELSVDFDGRLSRWCIEANGGLVLMVIGDNEVTVKRARDEAEAKSVLKQ